MAASSKKSSLNIDFSVLFEKLKSQFSDLDRNDPSTWPLLPRLCMLLGIVLMVLVIAWFALINTSFEQLSVAQQKEIALKEEYKNKLPKAHNIAVLKQQLEQVQQYVSTIEKQLPNKAEMDALLSDINQAGLGRGLQFELFRPEQIKLQDYYAELPIAIKVTGKYHDIGHFVGDVASLSRIVTLNQIQLTAPKDNKDNKDNKDRQDLLTLECIAKTFRYLDPVEFDLKKAERQAKEKEKEKSKGTT